MYKKLFIGLVVLIVIVVAGGFAYLQYGSSLAPVPTTPNPQTIAPGGSVTSISNTSITIQPQNGTSATFAIDSATQIISQVTAGEVGKSLGDIAVGDTVVVRPNPANLAVASSIEIFSAPSMPDTSTTGATSGPPVSLLGSVVSVTPSTLVIQPQGTSTTAVQVTVTKDTSVVSNVTAGQKGKSYADIVVGGEVFVSGTTGSKSVIANIIQILNAINQPAQ